MITTSTAPSGTLTRLDGRVAIVTGGSRGIGGAISSALAADGATIAVLGVPADRERTSRSTFAIKAST